MKRKLLTLALVSSAVLLLSACKIVIEPPVRQPDATVAAGNDADTAVGNYSVPAGGDLLVRVNVNTERPLLYIELSRDMELEVFNASRVRLASSRSSNFFGAGTDGLSSSSLESQAITLALACEGSCVILNRATSSHYYALIRNTSGSSQNVSLWAFGDFPADEFEGDNETASTLATYDVSGAMESGAIETLNDVDYWRVIGTGTVVFDAPNSALAMVAEVFNPSGSSRTAGPYTNGQSFTVYANELIRVSSSNSRAGASQVSDYYLSKP